MPTNRSMACLSHRCPKPCMGSAHPGAQQKHCTAERACLTRQARCQGLPCRNLGVRPHMTSALQGQALTHQLERCWPDLAASQHHCGPGCREAPASPEMPLSAAGQATASSNGLACRLINKQACSFPAGVMVLGPDLGVAWAALWHPAPACDAVVARRSLREVLGHLGPPSGRQRLSHVLQVPLTGPVPRCPHACAAKLSPCEAAVCMGLDSSISCLC